MVEDGAVAVDGGRDVPGRDLVGVALDRLDDFVRCLVLGDHLPLFAFAGDGVGQVVAALLEHPRHEPVELGEGLDGIGAEVLVESLPLALPLVKVETGVVHGPILRGVCSFKPGSLRIGRCECFSSGRGVGSTRSPGRSPGVPPSTSCTQPPAIPG